MLGPYGWWAAAIVLGIAEMTTGTFYLLVLAAAAALAGVSAWLGASAELQTLLGSVFAVLGVLGLQQCKKRWAKRPPKMSNNLDIGQRVEVLAWLGAEGRARVHYRGTQWDARLVDLDAARETTMRIVATEGSTLLIAPL